MQTSQNLTPLRNYQLQEVSADKMLLSATPTPKTNSKPRNSVSVNGTDTPFGYSSSKTQGQKHLELQKALKAQADSRAAKKRKNSVGLDFSERQEAQKKHKNDKLKKLQSLREQNQQEECYYSPMQAQISKKTKKQEIESKKERDEKKAL